MKLFIIISGLLVATSVTSTKTTTTACPLLPCYYCQPYGDINFGSTPPCHGCECNPCQYGQPLLNVTCGQGSGDCTKANGLCKINSADKVYCCPNERPNCCPTQTSTTGPCYALCTNDYDCKVGQKCCGSCPRTCQNATLI